MVEIVDNRELASGSPATISQALHLLRKKWLVRTAPRPASTSSWTLVWQGWDTGPLHHFINLVWAKQLSLTFPTPDHPSTITKAPLLLRKESPWHAAPQTSQTLQFIPNILGRTGLTFSLLENIQPPNQKKINKLGYNISLLPGQSHLIRINSKTDIPPTIS